MYVYPQNIQKYTSTNIKTSLNTAALAFDSIKNLGTDLNPATLAAYNTQLSGLTATQQKMALSTTNLTLAQQKQVLSYIAETAAAKSLTAQQIAELSIDQKQALIKAGLITQEQIETGVTLELSKAQLQKIITSDAISTKDKELILGAFGVTGANLTETSSWEVLGASIKKATAAMLKWLFLTPAGWATLAITAIAGTIVAYNKWGDTLENNRKKLEELKSEAQTISSDLQTFNSELQTTQQRISELESKGNLTFTEAEELENLRKQNNELQRSIDLLKLKEKENNKGKNKTFVKTMQKNVDVEDERVQTGRLNPDDTAETEMITEAELIERKFNTLDELQEKLRRASTETEKKAIQEQIDKITKYLSECNEQYIEDAEGIDYIQNPTTEDDKKVNEWLDYINDFQDKMAIAMGGDNAKENAFNRLVDNWKFDEALNPLQKLGKEGKVTLEELKKRMDDPVFVEFVNKLKDIGFISDTTDGSLRFLASAFNGTTVSAKAYLDSLDDNESLSNFINNLDDEAKALGTTKDELSKLTAGHIILNNTKLSLDDKINQIKQLGIMAGWAEGKVEELVVLMNRAAGNLPDSMTQAEKDARSGSAQLALYNFFGGWKQVDTDVDNDTPPYSPSGDDKGSSKDNTPDYEDPTDAIINRINLRSKELEQQEEQIENAIEIAELENDYKKQISSTNDLIATRKKRVDELNKANAELHQMAEDLRNSTPDWNEEEWFDSQGNATEAYNTLYNNRSKEEQEKLKDQFEKISKIKKAWVENEKLINELTIENIKSIKEISDIESEALQSRFEERNADSERWLEVEEGFDQLSIENKVAAYARMVRNNREFLKEIEQDDKLSAEERDEIWKEYYEKIVDYQLEAYDLVKKAIQQYGEEVEKGYDIRISRLSSESSLLSTHFDLINAISEEQHNLNKELAEAEIAGAKMNELEKQTLFTKEEHTTLSAKLSKIMGDANSLQSDYLADLKTATEDTIEEITNNYERQYELKMKEYEVVKAELNLIKAQQKLENVENEKSVRTWNGEEWVYEANYQDVVDAKLAVEDAKYAVVKAETEQAQQNAINAIDSTAESLETQKNLFARTMEELSGETKITGKQLTDALKNIAETDLPTFEKIVEQFGDSLSSVFGIDIDSIRSSVGVASSSGGKLSHLKYSSTIAQMRANSAKWESASQSERDKLHSTNIGLGNSIGASYDSSTGTWKDKNGNRLYANGTKHALHGWGMFDENGFGSELILTNDGILTQFNGGERVFDQEMSDRLWEMAQQNYTFAHSSPQLDFSKLTPIEERISNAVSNSISNISNAFGDTYMIKDVKLNESEGGELKGFINFLKRKV